MMKREGWVLRAVSCELMARIVGLRSITKNDALWEMHGKVLIL